MANQDTQNIVWHKATVTRNEREKLLGQKGLLLWFTGLSGSGKSTIAKLLVRSYKPTEGAIFVNNTDTCANRINDTCRKMNASGKCRMKDKFIDKDGDGINDNRCSGMGLGCGKGKGKGNCFGKKK